MNPTHMFRQLLFSYRNMGNGGFSFATNVHRVQDWWFQPSLKDFTQKATCNEYESNMQLGSVEDFF